MSDYPNERDCEHGHKRGKCVSCDLIESESRVRELEATLAARTESLEAALESRAAMESERDTIRAECDRLRGELEPHKADVARLDSGKIVTSYRDEFGDTRRTFCAGVNLRKDIDEAMVYFARLGAE